MDWKLVEHRATAHWGETTAVVDTLDLRSGLSIPNGPWQGSNIGTLPKMAPPINPASVESYVRGTDLVTTHPATTKRPTRVQLYWRRWGDLPAKITAVVELIASVQTHLLDSDPTLVIECRLPTATKLSVFDEYSEVLVENRHLLVLTKPEDGIEAELIETQPRDTSILRHTLFRQRLEKGVILRGRMLFVWSNDGLDADALQECTNRFNSSEPMLTA